MNASTERLDPATHMDMLSLRVRHLPGLLAYYTDGVGLVPLSEGSGRIALGLGDRAVLELVHAPELRPAPSSSAGLYHTAVLFDTRSDLAASLHSMASRYPQTFIGSADHLVSEAFYFTDPEGNGLELYVDRPREQWRWTGDQVAMDSLPLDPNRFVASHLDRNAAESSSGRSRLVGRLGHAHLQIGDIETAHRFYVGTLGFDQTARMGRGALFVSAGGYHHHIGLNTWNSRGAGVRSKTLGLGSLDIAVPTREELDRIAERLRFAGHEIRDDGNRITTYDPWGNEVRIGQAV